MGRRQAPGRRSGRRPDALTVRRLNVCERNDQSRPAELARPFGVEARAQLIEDGDGAIAGGPGLRVRRLAGLGRLQPGELDQGQSRLVRVALRVEDGQALSQGGFRLVRASQHAVDLTQNALRLP